MIRVWCSIAQKLQITQEQALMLHALLRGWLSKVARFQCTLIIDDIVERFGLVEDWNRSYGKQLLEKGILNATEAEVFSGNEQEAQEAGEPANGTTEGA